MSTRRSSRTSLRSKNIGSILMELGVVEQPQIDKALKIQKQKSALLGQILVKLGYIQPDDLAQALKKQFNVTDILVSKVPIDIRAVQLVPKEDCEKFKLLPFEQIGDLLCVAMANPLNRRATAKIEAATELKVKPFKCPWPDIQKRMQQVFDAMEKQGLLNQPATSDQPPEPVPSTPQPEPEPTPEPETAPEPEPTPEPADNLPDEDAVEVDLGELGGSPDDKPEPSAAYEAEPEPENETVKKVDGYFADDDDEYDEDGHEDADPDNLPPQQELLVNIDLDNFDPEAGEGEDTDDAADADVPTVAAVEEPVDEPVDEPLPEAELELAEVDDETGDEDEDAPELALQDAESEFDEPALVAVEEPVDEPLSEAESELVEVDDETGDEDKDIPESALQDAEPEFDEPAPVAVEEPADELVDELLPEAELELAEVDDETGDEDEDIPEPALQDAEPEFDEPAPVAVEEPTDELVDEPLPEAELELADATEDMLEEEEEEEEETGEDMPEPAAAPAIAALDSVPDMKKASPAGVTQMGDVYVVDPATFPDLTVLGGPESYSALDAMIKNDALPASGAEFSTADDWSDDPNWEILFEPAPLEPITPEVYDGTFDEVTPDAVGEWQFKVSGAGPLIPIPKNT